MTDVRPWTYAALFGALWGALEATMGTALYLGRVPFNGTMMGIVGLLCLICLRRLQPRPGVCLLAGAVAVFLKVFTLGGFYTGTIIGITVEALSVEIAMTGLVPAQPAATLHTTYFILNTTLKCHEPKLKASLH